MAAGTRVLGRLPEVIVKMDGSRRYMHSCLTRFNPLSSKK
jgi:hypothetical protein